MDCPKCAGEVIPAEGRTYLCSKCKRPYSEQEFGRFARVVFTEAGTLFLQPLIIIKKEEVP